MKRILFFLICVMCFAQAALAQPATYGIPVGLGRNNCGSGGGTNNDSMYFFNYASGALTRASYPNAYKPRLKIGSTSTTDRWSIFQASISFNPKDQKLYYLWTDYAHNITRTGAFPTPAYTYTYIWRWRPDTTFTVGATVTGNYIDTLRSFPYDIGGVAFDNNGIGWTLEFPPTNPCARAFFRPIDFAGNVYNPADTLDFTSGPGGIGDTLWNPGSGDITMLPSGQIYYNFDNKLYTPDYGSYGGPTHHIKSTFIDTTRRPTGTSALVGLSFADGDLVASYATGCIYRKLDPVTGDTNNIAYTYASGKGVYSVDMTQINSGIGSSKKLVSVTATGTPGQYNVVYDVYVRNYGTVPLTNVQVSDNLGLINGASNVSNVSAVFTSNPAGLTLNPTYNGTGFTNLLLGTETLPNYPTSNNNLTIRISCTLSNIASGQVYNNQAVATAGGFNNFALRDSSTNGNNPDLNQNDKPDDIGESQPTPFVIVLTPTAAPCTVLGNVLYTQDFGSGTTLKSAIPTSPNTASTTYIGTTTAPLAINRFTITDNANKGDASNWISLTDHTGGANGNMMLINADASANYFYRDTLPVACPGQQYSVTLWAAFIGNTTYQTTCNGLGGFKYPKFLIKIRDLTTGLVVTQSTTADITATTWTQYGMKFNLPAGYSNLILEIQNSGPGGCGNDVAIDDIQFGSCSAAPTVSVGGVGGCLGTSTTFNSALSDPTAISGTPVYQWQVASALAGPYSNIGGATSATYTIPSLAASDTGKFYRLIVAATGNMGVAACQYISTGIKLNGLAPSVAPSSVNITAATICASSSTTLTAVGGTLGTGANYQWGTGSVVGTNPIVGATSATLTVSPASTTTYWVQIQNTTSPCAASTGGVTKTVTVNTPSVAPSSVTGADVCAGGTTTLTALGGALGTGANYQWGTGSVVGTNPIVGATGATYNATPGSSTTYWVRIQNTTAPCTATTSGLTKLITVNTASVAPSSVTGADICAGGTTTLTALGGSLGTSANYQWGTGSVVGTNPIVGATGATYNATPGSSTTYWVQIQNTASPCVAATSGLTKLITVNTPSAAPSSITGANVCAGGTTTLTALGGTLGTGANYQWGTGSVVGTSPIVGATGATYNATPGSSTTYWVQIQNTTAPCTATTSGLTKLITVNTASVAPSSVTGADICAGGTTTLTALGGSLGTSANYQWGTGSVVGTNPIVGATGATYNATPGSSTTYWVQIQNTAAPCTAATSGLTKLITVNTPSAAPSSITGADICNGSSTTLTALGGTLGTGANYQWGTGSVVGTSPIVGATGATYTASPGITTTYWVQIQNTTSPCAATTSGLTKVITVSQPSVAAASATKSKNNICPGISVTLGITGGTLGTGASWKWYTGSAGGTLVGSGTSLTVTPAVTTTYYVRAEGTCNNTVDRSVTVFISCDIDKDKDGIPDVMESNMAAATADANSNGVINAYDPTYAGFVDNNNDYINDNFQADGDSNNDGIPNYLDPTFPGRVDSNGDGIDDRFDTDKDGIINMLDLDSDNDGIPDVVEAYGVDTNGDGKIDNFTDTDGDGLSQNVDNNNTGAYNTGLGLGNRDFDGDGIPNFLDTDSDNDGIPDVVEAGGADSNNDGIIDGFVDVNGDGLHDSYTGASGLMLTGADINGDGKADSYPNKNLDGDLRPNAYDIDSDGDGIVDVIEAGLPDANLDGKVDGVIATNGWSTSVSSLGSLSLRNTDGIGNPDYLDIDSDGDGITDNIEGQPTAAYKLPGATDTDGDGLVDTYDNISGFGGSGIFVYDFDGDGIPDYRDLDTDGDGALDILEGNDWNLNGLLDETLTPTGIDTDGDGLDDRFDLNNSSAKGTSSMMGTSGSLVGDASPGTRATVQKKTPGQIDRDWRFVGVVLPVQILNFSGSLQGSKTQLGWLILATKDVDHFEIERSLDNSTYAKVGIVTDAVKLNEQQSFTYNDDISNVSNDVIYYRLKVIGKAGEIKYSNVLVIRRTQTKTPISIMPNPASDYVTVKFFTDKESEVTVRLVDNLGKTAMLQKVKALKGNNVVPLTGLARFGAGVYTIQVYVNDELVTKKLILNH